MTTIDTALITRRRMTEPRAVAAAWAARRRRDPLSDDGRLLLVAADHPARGALAVRGDSRAMASRPALLDRLGHRAG